MYCFCPCFVFFLKLVCFTLFLQLNDEDFGSSEPWRWLPEPQAVPPYASVIVSVLPDDPKRQLAILTTLRERLPEQLRLEVEVKTMTADDAMVSM